MEEEEEESCGGNDILIEMVTDMITVIDWFDVSFTF